ncbi:MAG: pyrroline-5-carboxylate reductase family protein [Promethearchaeota archaeon]
MIKKVGIIGIGHLASYLVKGLRKASTDIEIILSPRNVEKSASLASQFRAIVTKSNQMVADTSDIIILTTRPEDTVVVAKETDFKPNHIVISVAAGLSLETLKPVTIPATIVRAMPISCAAINESPTLLFPDNLRAQELLALLGQVHILPDESSFTSASVIGAFYGWIYALLEEIISWTTQIGVPQHTARNLILETVRGAVNMALIEPKTDLNVILESLTTPGGITKQGLDVLYQKKGLEAWIEALNTVYKRLSVKKE